MITGCLRDDDTAEHVFADFADFADRYADLSVTDHAAHEQAIMAGQTSAVDSV